jgi:hypothetical protein
VANNGVAQTRANNEQIEIKSINGWLPPFFVQRLGGHLTPPQIQMGLANLNKGLNCYLVDPI